jgi:hypothetical protein
MIWTDTLLALVVSHAVGDVLLQTEWQATQKPQGLSRGAARRALGSHVAVYTSAFVPALAWVSTQRSPGRAVTVAGLVAVPHLIIDDGRLVTAWLRNVKRAPEPAPGLTIAVDQTFHLVSLLAAAMIAAR